MHVEAEPLVAELRVPFASARVLTQVWFGELGIGYRTWIEWNDLDISGVVLALLGVGVAGITLDTRCRPGLPNGDVLRMAEDPP